MLLAHFSALLCVFQLLIFTSLVCSFSCLQGTAQRGLQHENGLFYHHICGCVREKERDGRQGQGEQGGRPQRGGGSAG